MKVLIFGVSGMLGHKLFQVLGERFDVSGTIRSDFASVTRFGIFDRDRVIDGIEVTNINAVESVLEKIRPDVVINSVGVIKQKPASKNVISTLNINSIFPHRLAELSARLGFRLICISTDCVFKGDRGNYSEADVPDALDLYGQSKHWGEVTERNCLTLRTSIIGHELGSSHNLVDWFFSNIGGTVKGFRKAIFSGFPTITFAKIVADLVDEHADLSGLYHVSSEPIDKYSLLKMVKKSAGLDIDIEPEKEFVIDRSLNSDRFRSKTGFQPLGWQQMIDDMCADPTDYSMKSSPATSP